MRFTSVISPGPGRGAGWLVSGPSSRVQPSSAGPGAPLLVCGRIATRTTVPSSVSHASMTGTASGAGVEVRGIDVGRRLCRGGGEPIGAEPDAVAVGRLPGDDDRVDPRDIARRVERGGDRRPPRGRQLRREQVPGQVGAEHTSHRGLTLIANRVLAMTHPSTWVPARWSRSENRAGSSRRSMRRELVGGGRFASEACDDRAGRERGEHAPEEKSRGSVTAGRLTSRNTTVCRRTVACRTPSRARPFARRAAVTVAAGCTGPGSRPSS